MRVAIIPARGGSKRIPNKNIRDFHGKPVIAWSINAAKASGCFDRIIVSTDNDEIARLSVISGAEVPFERPKELADDFTGVTPVVKHAIQWCLDQGEDVSQVCCLCACAPLLIAEDIVKSLKVLQDEACAFAYSVAQYRYPIQRALRIDGEGRVHMIDPDQAKTRSQDLQESYHDAGQFYWGTTESWLAIDSILQSDNAKPFVLPEYRVQDIDTFEDWDIAESKFEFAANRDRR